MVRVVNEMGAKEIKDFLNMRHKYAYLITDFDMWITDYNYQLEGLRSHRVEIGSYFSVSGKTEFYTVTDNGLSEVV